MNQFDTKKLFDLLDTLQPKLNYLLLNDPDQNESFNDKAVDSDKEKYEQAVFEHGEKAKRNLIALAIRDEEIEIMRKLVEAIPTSSKLFGEPITANDVYHCRIVFINTEIEAVFGIGLGRKTRVFNKGPFDASGNEQADNLDRFKAIDWSNSIESITDCLAEVGSALDSFVYADPDNADESEELEDQIYEALDNLNKYLELEFDDLENDNH